MISENGRKPELVILVADDEPLVRNLVGAVLSDAGYRVLDAADGEQALEVSRQYDGSIDFLLTDITMPKMNGIELSLRIVQERPGIKVLMMSGVVSTELVPDQLHNLVAPIALYPDPLLSQTLAASTYPLEIVEAQQWLQQNSNLQRGQLMDRARQQSWDPSVQALVAFPDALRLLSSDIRWTT